MSTLPKPTLEQIRAAMDVLRWMDSDTTQPIKQHVYKTLEELDEIEDKMCAAEAVGEKLPKGTRVAASITIGDAEVSWLGKIEQISKNTKGANQYVVEGLEGWISEKWIQAR